MSESSFRYRLRNLLAAEGIWVLGQPASAETGSGRSDFLALCPEGVAVFVELKDHGGEYSPEQISFVKKLRDWGFMAFGARTPKQALLGIRYARQGGRLKMQDAMEFDFSFLSGGSDSASLAAPTQGQVPEAPTDFSGIAPFPGEEVDDVTDDPDEGVIDSRDVETAPEVDFAKTGVPVSPEVREQVLAPGQLLTGGWDKGDPAYVTMDPDETFLNVDTRDPHDYRNTEMWQLFETAADGARQLSTALFAISKKMQYDNKGPRAVPTHPAPSAPAVAATPSSPGTPPEKAVRRGRAYKK